MVRDRERFDEFAVAVAEEQTRRTLLGRVGGGSLAALLAAAGLGLGGDEAEAKSKCKKKCKKKNSKKARKKCLKRCKRKDDAELLQTGSATLVAQSGDTCVEDGECIDEVNGELTGTPIAEGTFEGTLTATNFDVTDPAAVTADSAGTLTATETATGDTLIAAVELTETLSMFDDEFTFTGTYTITGGTGRFADAGGSGTISGNGTRNTPWEDGVVDSFTMQGDIDLA